MMAKAGSITPAGEFREDQTSNVVLARATQQGSLSIRQGMAHRAILTGLGPVCSCNRVVKLHEHLSRGVSNDIAACSLR